MSEGDPARVVTASRSIAAGAALVFELIADPARQPSWDGNDNLATAREGQRVTAVGQVFESVLTGGSVRENHVVEFTEGTLIAWLPAEPGRTPPGHLWRWEIDVVDDTHVRVTHTYDWTNLADPSRLARAQATTEDRLRASLDRLGAAAEAATARGGVGGMTELATVRYLVDDVDEAVRFYTTHLGFRLELQAGTAFADVRRGALRLLLSGTESSGARATPAPIAATPGRNRINLAVTDIEAEVARLSEAGLTFASTLVTGPGGSQVLINDSSRSLIEIFQPRSR